MQLTTIPASSAEAGAQTINNRNKSNKDCTDPHEANSTEFQLSLFPVYVT